MTQREKIMLLLRRGPCTALDFLYTRFEDGKMVTNEWRARMTELRKELKKDGGDIRYDRKTKLYTLIEPKRTDAHGQYLLETVAA